MHPVHVRVLLEVAKAVGLRVAIGLLRAYLARKKSRRRRAPPQIRGARRKTVYQLATTIETRYPERWEGGTPLRGVLQGRPKGRPVFICGTFVPRAAL